MKNLYLLILILFTNSLSSARPFATGNTTVTFVDPSRGNRAIPTAIYYPASTNGTNVPLIAGQSFPVIAFGHGFVMSVAAYQNIWSALVEQGYIVALPNTETGILPNHTNFGRDLAFVISSLQQAGNTPGNFFHSGIASTSAVMGHSMGGGAAMLSVQYNAAITAVAALAPAETNPSAAAAALQINQPALILAGGNDCVTPAAQHSRLIYDNLGSTCKYYLSINGASHCQFANQNFNCSLGEATCSPSAAITRVTQQALVNEYLLPWLDFELKGTCANWISKQSSIGTDVRLSPVFACNGICPAPSGRSISNLKPNSVKFNWNLSACGNTYEVRYRPTGSGSWLKKLTAVNNRIVYNLIPGTTYEWQLRSICDALAPVQSSWGSLRTFTTPAASARLSSVDNDMSFSLFPNPGNSFIQLSGENFHGEKALIHVYNTIGQEVANYPLPIAEGEIKTTIDFSELPNGIYIVKVSTGEQSLTRRLVIH